jgi:glutamate synthase (NADPH/NADH) large chain
MKENMNNEKINKGLYETQFEHDNCGIGAVVNIKGKQSHKIVDDALKSRKA